MMHHCPSCGLAPLVHATRDMVYSYKGKHTTIPEVMADCCAGCNEVIFTVGELEHYGDLIRAFRRGVDRAGPRDIRAMRKALGLSLGRADAMFGEEEGGFARYEAGQAQAPVALVKLLELLGRHPRLLDELA
ncbi:type II toxin-antitoxin system MqsA family antitoxin [Massilia sp. H6]|uniref:type II toxin-antitoxin system MqsA family antitoxin n=1 Tax=Massilia sp. H6 TaxID=2970464 RepID=UPI00216757CF|nr:type II toxin-antitoxin system MqsA family antitoxin [Massilia sp. H6]UVW26836.1 type II toxin-antitoxin system MqsA family antitoxin [Massilia sp. H6]